MSQIAALAAACCCPRETTPPCQPTETAIVVSMPSILFDFGCLDYTFSCGSSSVPGEQFRCCCPSGSCFGNGSPCDSAAWDCRSLRVTGSVTPAFVMRADYLGGPYRTRVRCADGLDESYYGGKVEGERPQCNSIAWPGGGGYVLYRQAYVGARACVGNTTYPVPFGTCDTGCSEDTSRSIFAVRAILQPFAGQTVIDGCVVVVRKIHVAVDVVSSRLAAQWCRCNPTYEFTDILSAGYSMEYFNYCCPSEAQGGVTGTYRATEQMIEAAAAPVAYECYRTGTLLVSPVKWPRTLTVL